ncbi:Protein of unknown function [Leuconostoc citreum LBAE C10]|nr:Protein of unknown function [Leuconostoc citreum LBAE C10]
MHVVLAPSVQVILDLDD